ncbi:MAG: flagellar assembly protein FliW [Acidimicrobiales bacterium]
MQSTVNLPVTLPCMEITLRREMLGWIGATHFLLEPIDGDIPGMFAELRCTDDDVRLRSGVAVSSPRFLMLTPWYLWPGYQVVLDDEFADALDIRVEEDATLLAIVTQRVPLERSTVNLFSPIVVNRHNGLADQFVPATSEIEAGWRVRTPLLPPRPADEVGEGGIAC